MKKSEVMNLINKFEIREVKFFSRHGNNNQILFKSSNGINYIVVDFKAKQGAQR